MTEAKKTGVKFASEVAKPFNEDDKAAAER